MEIIIFIIIMAMIWLFIKSNKGTKTYSSQDMHSIEYTYDIVGEQAYQQNLKKIAGPKESESKFFECYAKVVSEPSNQYDKNAIKVEIDGLLVGYLSKSEAIKLSGKEVNKTVPAVIDGGWKNKDSAGSYGVKLAITSINDLA